MQTSEQASRFAPSLKVGDDKVECSLTDFQKLLRQALSAVRVDERWYMTRYPDVRRSVVTGKIKSATEHFLTSGFLEGRLPAPPIVDEAWYCATYPDVAEAIKRGEVSSATQHFIDDGHAEGRLPRQPDR